MKIKFSLVFCFGLMVLSSCKYVTYSENKPQKKYIISTNVTHPDWTENSVLYNVNISKYTPEGTINAFLEHLPRLHGMGVEIILISHVLSTEDILSDNNEKFHSCTTGNFLEIDPKVGTGEDLENLIKEAHSLEMYVIFDWQPEMISAKNPIALEHPSWCLKTEKKDLEENTADSLAEIKLDYSNQEVSKYMLDAMKYWVTDFDIDGYLCNNAGNLPCEFWNTVRSDLDEIKPVFMVAEDEAHPCLVENAFDMNFGFKLSSMLDHFNKGVLKVKEIKSYFTGSDSIFAPEIYRMNFTNQILSSSLKENETKKMEKAAEAITLLTFIVPGMPLINECKYNETDLQLDSLRQGTLNWSNDKRTKMIKSFIKLKKTHVVFWNGAAGGSFEVLDSKVPKHIFAFIRESDDENAVVLFNLSDKPAKFKIKGNIPEGNFYDYFSSLSFDLNDQIELQPFGYHILLDEF